MPKFADRVKETTTTTGTGNITLAGAVSQYESFSANFDISAVFYYSIVGQTGTEWEVGRGYLSASSTLVRDTVLSSSNADSLVSFSAGTKEVFLTIPANFASKISLLGRLLAVRTGLDMP